MALSDNLKNSAEEIKRLNDLGTEFQAVYGDIGNTLNGLARDSKEFASGIRNAEGLSKDLAKSAQELAKFTEGDLADRKTKLKFDAKSQELAKKRANLESQLRVFRSQSLNATKQEKAILDKVIENLDNQVDYTKEIAGGYDDILKATTKIEGKNIFKGAAEFLDAIPGASVVLGEFGKAADTFNKSMAEGNSQLQSTVKGFQQLGGVVAKFTLGLAVKGLKDFDERTVSVGRNLNVSREQSDALVKSANAFARSQKGIGTTGKENTASQIAFSNALGTTVALSDETAANFTRIQKFLGLSVEQATELTKLSIITGEDSKTQTENLIGQVRVLNAQTDSSIKYQEVVKDIAGTNKATLLSIQGQEKSLAAASFEAKKLGLSLNEVDNIAGSLLNFEESISAELEAELLTGKELNLEKAREAAFNNDLATVTAEIAKNVGSAEEFGSMNRYQQEAIAKAVGMTRESLAASLVEQETLVKLNKMQGIDADNINEATKQRLAQIEAIENVEERELARKELINSLGSTELAQQIQNQSIAEKQAEASQKMIESFDNLSGLLTPISGVFDVILKNIKLIQGILITITGLTIFAKFKNLGKIFTKMKGASKAISKFFGKDVAKTAGKVATATMKGSGKKISGAAAQAAVKAGSATATKTIGKTVGKTAAKTAGKSLIKKIPGIGLVAGLAFAADRLMKGDFMGAGLEVASGAASLLPGIGTGASLAIDAGIAARDISKANSSAPEAADFISRPGQPVQRFRKDDIIVGGTNLGGGGNEEVITLLKELITAVNTGGNVYMDSTKVGTALTVGSYKLQ